MKNEQHWKIEIINEKLLICRDPTPGRHETDIKEKGLLQTDEGNIMKNKIEDKTSNIYPGQ